VTAPDLRTPEEVEEAILLVGRVCRSTGHVRVGMGASRQDVNVSVRGGRRVEIKGVPQAGWAPRLVHGEAWRQVNLLRLRDELRRRGFARPGDFGVDSADVSDVFEGSPLTQLSREAWERFVREAGWRPALELGGGPFQVRAGRLRGLAGTLGWPTQPGRSFADELAGRIRVIACLDQPPILLHSEDWPRHPGAERELGRIRERLACGPDDAVVVVWGPEDDARTAVDEVRLRYVDALDGIPNETRQPFPDGHTDFERILPGPDRMYPDTDSPPTTVTRERVATLAAALPPRPWEREERLLAVGVPRATIHFLVRRGGAALVERVVSEANADLRQAGFFFGERLKGLQRRGVAAAAIAPERWVELFRAFAERPVLLEAWEAIVRALARDPSAPLGALLGRLGLSAPAAEWQSQLARRLAGQAGAFYGGDAERWRRFATGRALDTLRGRVPVAEVQAALEPLVPQRAGGARETFDTGLGA